MVATSTFIYLFNLIKQCFASSSNRLWAALKRYTWHSNGLLWTDFTRYMCGSIVRSYKLLLYARHPALTAVRNTLQDFMLGYLGMCSAFAFPCPLQLLI
jgi:hypothetical protein